MFLYLILYISSLITGTLACFGPLECYRCTKTSNFYYYKKIEFLHNINLDCRDAKICTGGCYTELLIGFTTPDFAKPTQYHKLTYTKLYMKKDCNKDNIDSAMFCSEVSFKKFEKLNSKYTGKKFDYKYDDTEHDQYANKFRDNFEKGIKCKEECSEHKCNNIHRSVDNTFTKNLHKFVKSCRSCFLKIKFKEHPISPGKIATNYECINARPRKIKLMICNSCFTKITYYGKQIILQRGCDKSPIPQIYLNFDRKSTFVNTEYKTCSANLKMPCNSRKINIDVNYYEVMNKEFVEKSIKKYGHDDYQNMCYQCSWKTTDRLEDKCNTAGKVKHQSKFCDSSCAYAFEIDFTANNKYKSIGQYSCYLDIRDNYKMFSKVLDMPGSEIGCHVTSCVLENKYNWEEKEVFWNFTYNSYPGITLERCQFLSLISTDSKYYFFENDVCKLVKKISEIKEGTKPDPTNYDGYIPNKIKITRSKYGYNIDKITVYKYIGNCSISCMMTCSGDYSEPCLTTNSNDNTELFYKTIKNKMLSMDVAYFEESMEEIVTESKIVKYKKCNKCEWRTSYKSDNTKCHHEFKNMSTEMCDTKCAYTLRDVYNTSNTLYNYRTVGSFDCIENIQRQRTIFNTLPDMGNKNVSCNTNACLYNKGWKESEVYWKYTSISYGKLTIVQCRLLSLISRYTHYFTFEKETCVLVKMIRDLELKNYQSFLNEKYTKDYIINKIKVHRYMGDCEILCMITCDANSLAPCLNLDYNEHLASIAWALFNNKSEITTNSFYDVTINEGNEYTGPDPQPSAYYKLPENKTDREILKRGYIAEPIIGLHEIERYSGGKYMYLESNRNGKLRNSIYKTGKQIGKSEQNKDKLYYTYVIIFGVLLALILLYCYMNWKKYER